MYSDKVVFAALRIMLGAAQTGVDSIMEDVFEKQFFQEAPQDVKKELQGMFDRGEFDKLAWYYIHRYRGRMSPGYELDDFYADLV